MSAFNKILTPLLCGAIVLLQGCIITPAAQIKPEAFDGKKRYALVSVTAAPTIERYGDNGHSLVGLFKAASADAGFREDADAIFEKSYPGLIAQLDAAPQFQLMTSKQLNKYKAFRQLPAEAPSMLGIQMLMAKGYRSIESEKQCAELAEKLKTDGCITLNISYMYANSGFSLGIVDIAKQRAFILLNIHAMDREGNIIWRDTIQQESTDHLNVAGSTANFKELEPLLIEATNSAMKAALASLEKKLAGG